MSSGSTFRTAVVAAKAALVEGRQKLRKQHDEGSPGIQVCAKLTDVADRVLCDLLDVALDDLAAIDGPSFSDLRNQVSLVAHGGYGRRELAPFSDIDLMILHQPVVSDRVAVLAERMMRDIFDTGLILGHSVRTTHQAISLARKDPQILTSLTESRHLAGCEELTDRFVRQLRKMGARRAKTLLPMVDEARRAERRQYGETVFLLEPNIKRSRGGLRDVQLVRWIGFCVYGMTDLDGLYLAGALDKEEQKTLRKALEFLLRTRNEVHFHADKLHDKMDRAEQIRLAERFGYEGTQWRRPVERFMQDYFRHTRAVRYISSRFMANAYRSSRVVGLLGTMFSHRVEGDFRVGPYRISATKQGLERLRSDFGEVLRLAELATLYDKRISHDTWEAVRQAASVPHEISPEIAARFLSMLSRPPQLFAILNRLHELGMLEKLIPAIARTRGMLQFNDYHKYTVDEHCLRAVRRATEFSGDDGPVGRVYAAIRQKHIVHLALLIHDLGKGYEEDHSEVGKRIATETAAHLYLPPHETEMLEFLVHKHLLMSHWALWHDINDPAILLRFAVEVGSPELLRKLYVVTAADLAAVGPGVLNDWKIELLTEFYQRTMNHLTGEDPVTSDGSWLQTHRDEVSDDLAGEADADWYRHAISALPSAYLRGTPPERIAEALRRLHDTAPDDVVAWGEYQEDRGVIEFTVGTHESFAPGIFHRLTGALSSEGVEILSAQINTLHEGWVLDRFHVLDPDFAAASPEARVEAICDALVRALKEPQSGEPKVRRIWGQQATSNPNLSGLPTRVLYDNATSDRASIFQIFAPDRPGLLYKIAKSLYDSELSIIAAKIGTHLDQVVDVFYVCDSGGQKINDEQRLEAVRKSLMDAVESFEAHFQAAD